MQSSSSLQNVMRRTTPVFRQLIEQLVHRRKALGITQWEVNFRIGCADSLVAKWEAGHRYPNTRHLLLWADALGVRLTVEQTDD